MANAFAIHCLPCIFAQEANSRGDFAMTMKRFGRNVYLQTRTGP